MESYLDVEKLARVIQHGLQGFIISTGESMEVNDLSHIL